MITTTDPKLENRTQQPYVGVRSQVPMSDFGNVIPQSLNEKDLTVDTCDADAGDGFGGRFEFFLTDPDQEPNPSNWQTEVAMRLADKPSA